MRNQCDGCQAGLPLDDKGHHISPKGPWDGMVCQADRYTRIDLPTGVEGKVVKLIGPHLDGYNGFILYFTDDTELRVFTGTDGEYEYTGKEPSLG